MMRIHSFSALLLCAMASLLICAGCGRPVTPPAATASTIPSVSPAADDADSQADAFDPDGNLRRPARHREWVFIGAPVTPNDMNEGHAAFPEFHNVYIDPDSYREYQQTGEFRDGTVILKELVSVGGKSMASGNGYFQGDFVSLEAMVKDQQRFPDEPGGWAFFRFGEAPNYAAIGNRMPTSACNDCHAGASEDYVFSDTYPVLRAARPADH